jgi:enoyl-[acyl-carrier protein] reductase I
LSIAGDTWRSEKSIHRSVPSTRIDIGGRHGAGEGGISFSPSHSEDVMDVIRGNGTLMAGKRGLVMGVANHRSLAWGIARALTSQGAELAYSYFNQSIRERLLSLLLPGDTSLVLECDVSSEKSMEAMFRQIKSAWGSLDFLVHAIAYAPMDDLRGRFIDTRADAFRKSMDVSCYSLAALSRLAEPLLNDHASILTLTYLGSQRVCPNYNVMGVAKAALEATVRYLAVDLGGRGIRVNAISAGPIKTLSAAGVSDFRQALKLSAANSPLRRNVTTDDVGGAALFLLSDLSTGITGEIVYVDGGYNVMATGMLDTAPAGARAVDRDVAGAEGVAVDRFAVARL